MNVWFVKLQFKLFKSFRQVKSYSLQQDVVSQRFNFCNAWVISLDVWFIHDSSRQNLFDHFCKKSILGLCCNDMCITMELKLRFLYPHLSMFRSAFILFTFAVLLFIARFCLLPANIFNFDFWYGLMQPCIDRPHQLTKMSSDLWKYIGSLAQPTLTVS